MIMQSTKRRTDKEDKSPFTLSFRFSKDLVEKISTRWSEEGFANRTALVEAACNFYFDTFECPRCKNRNHINSLYCSICGNAFKPVYELKKFLKEFYEQDFQVYLDRVLSFERGFEQEREKCYKKITTSKLDEELRESLLDVLKETPDEYWLSDIHYYMEEGELDTIYSNAPMDCRSYVHDLNEVQEFFKSSTYLKDNPILTEDKANEIMNFIENSIDFLIKYEIMLKKAINICLKVDKLIDKLTERDTLSVNDGLQE